jgi:membrane fusion protein, multidrug efflux system
VTGALTRHEPTQVRVLPVVRKEMRRMLETTTVVESERNVVVHARAVGLVTELLAEEGDLVEKDQVLARLDQRDTQAQLDDAKVALREAEDALANGEISKREAAGNIDKRRLAFEQTKRSYDRNEKAKLISAQDLEQLKLEMDTADQDLESAILAKDRSEIDARAAGTAVERAKLAVRRAEITLSYTELRAPFAGVVARRGIQVGDNVSAAEEAFTVIDLGDLRSVIYRPQRELALFAGPAMGETGGFEEIEVTATTEALPDHVFTGHIERISPGIDAASGSFRVTVRLDEESGDSRLLPGMLLRLRLVTERHPDALAVSKRALRREGDATILFVARDGVAERIPVEEGFSDDDYVEVRVIGEAELSPGTEVIVVGNRDLEDGKEIEIAPWDDEVVEAEPEEEAKKEPTPPEVAEEEAVETPPAPVEEAPAEEAPAEAVQAQEKPAEEPAVTPAEKPTAPPTEEKPVEKPSDEPPAAEAPPAETPPAKEEKKESTPPDQGA